MTIMNQRMAFDNVLLTFYLRFVTQLSKNFLSLLGSNFLVQGIRFLTIAVFARRFGSEVFGVYNYIILLVAYGFTFVEFGLKNLAIREISQGRGSYLLVKQILKVRSLLALVGVGGVIVLALGAFPSGVYFVPTLFFASSLFIDAFLLDFIIISREDLVWQALANVGQALFMYIAVLVFIKRSDQMSQAAIAFLLSHVVWVILFYVKARPSKTFPLKAISNSNVISVAFAGVPFLVTQLVGSLQNSMDLLLLGQFHFTAWLGDYGAALKILGLALGVINALISAVQPRLAKLSHTLDSSEMYALVWNTTRLLWIFSVPMVIGCFFFGNEIIKLFFGVQYQMAGTLLKPLSIAMALFFAGLAPCHGIYLSSRPKLMLRVVLVNATLTFIMVAGTLFFKKPQWVPWAMVFGQGVYMLSAWSPYHKSGFISWVDLRDLTLAGIMMVAPLILLRQNHVMLALIFSGISYTLGLLIVRIWTRPWIAFLMRKPA